MKSKRLWWLDEAECVKGCGVKGSIQNSAGESLRYNHVKPVMEKGK